MKSIPKDTLVKYRYVIPMSDRVDTINNVVNKWTGKYLEKIYYGQLMLLVSPIYLRKDTIYVQPVIDVDVPFNTAYKFISDFLKKDHRKKYWIAEYTGKTAFHLIARFAIRIKNPDLQYIRKVVYEPLKLLNDSRVDIVASIRDMPFLRIGFRRDTNKLAFPILKMDLKFIKQNINQKTFRYVFPKMSDLKEYINTWMFPSFYVEEEEYNEYI